MSSPEGENRLIVLGRVTKPQGVKGGLRVASFAESVTSFVQLDHVLLRSGKGEVRRYGLIQVREHSKGVILVLEGVEDRTAAEQLIGREVAVYRSELPETDDREYYWVDLIGLSVLDPQGAGLGRVKTLFRTGAHDILVVDRPRDGELLVPMVSEIVMDIDPAGGTMTIDMPLEAEPEGEQPTRPGDED